ncbi:MAG TPA: MFS transporter [Candidatus Binatia bacterium]|nr:MFS transporter [Candidatus Binatia bacterium]
MATAASGGRGLGFIARLAALTPSGRAGVPVAWALYDFANTIYSYAIVSYAMGLWVTDASRLGAADGQFWFGIANAASVGLNALVSPVLGAMSDRGGRKLPYLLFFTAQTIIATALIGLLAGGGSVLSFIGLGLFTIANFSYQAALIYYDATLPVVSKPATRGLVSGLGVAIGYVGTIVIALLILLTDSGATSLTFFMAAALYAIFAIPIFLAVREPKTSEYRFRVGDALASWSQIRTTLDDARAVPGLLRFLVARFVYTDPVNTVIVIMGVFAVEAIGLTQGQVNLLLLGLTVAAVAASFGWGWLVERIGPKRTLQYVLASWCVGLVIAGAVLEFPTFLAAGLLLGSGLGGVWTSDRVFMLRLSPRDKIGEFFGLYGLAGKFSAVTGPILYGTTVSVLLDAGWGKSAYQVGILSFLVLMAIGMLLLRGVPEPPSEPDGDGDVEGASPPPEHLIPAYDVPGPARH